MVAHSGPLVAPLLVLLLTVIPLLVLLATAVFSLLVIFELGEKWLLVLVVVMAMMSQHQIIEAIDFVRAGTVPTPVPETFETTANLFLAGAAYYLLAFARQEHRLAEELEESRNRYNQLVENAPSPILVLRDDEIVFANPMATNFFDRATTDALVGTDLLAFVDPDDRDQLRDELDNALETGYPIAISEIEFVTEEKHKQATSMAAPISYESGQALQIVLQDITERREYERQLDRTLQNTNDAVFIVDPATDEILECNRTACELLDYDRQDLLETPASEIHPGEVDRLAQFMQTAESGDGARTEALSCTRRDGQEVPAEISGSVIDFRGRQCLLAVVRDISERRRQERRLNVLDRVLRHNIRNDMNSVMGRAEILEDRLSDSRLVEMAETIRETAAALVERSDDLRDVASTIDRDRDSDLPTMDATAVVRDVIDRYQDEFPEASIEVDLPAELVVRATDALEIALAQVVENALEHNDAENPAVSVTGQVGGSSGEAVELHVSDNGPGIPEHERAVVMGEHEPTALKHGTGLGLWIVVWIVEALEGEVSIDESESGGTRVTFGLRRGSPTETHQAPN